MTGWKGKLIAEVRNKINVQKHETYSGLEQIKQTGKNKEGEKPFWEMAGKSSLTRWAILSHEPGQIQPQRRSELRLKRVFNASQSGHRFILLGDFIFHFPVNVWNFGMWRFLLLNYRKKKDSWVLEMWIFLCVKGLGDYLCWTLIKLLFVSTGIQW